MLNTFWTKLVGLAIVTLALLAHHSCLAATSTYNAAAAGGRFTSPGSAQATGFNVNVYQVFNATTNLASKGGSLGVINSSLWATAGMDHAVYSWEYTADNTLYAHVEITSKPFSFYDYALHLSYPAVLVVSLSKLGPMGQGGYKVIRLDTNTIINETTTTGISLTGGTYAEIPFTYAPCRITM